MALSHEVKRENARRARLAKIGRLEKLLIRAYKHLEESRLDYQLLHDIKTEMFR